MLPDVPEFVWIASWNGVSLLLGTQGGGVGEQPTNVPLSRERSPRPGSRLKSVLWDLQGTEGQRKHQGEAVFFSSLALSLGA